MLRGSDGGQFRDIMEDNDEFFPDRPPKQQIHALRTTYVHILHIFSSLVSNNMLNVVACWLFPCSSKSNYWGEDTDYFPCHTISQQSSCRVSDGKSQQRLVFEHGSLHLLFMTLKIVTLYGFLLLQYFLLSCDYTYSSDTCLPYEHRLRCIIWRFFTVFN